MGIREKRGREFKVNGVLSINPVVLLMTMAFLWGFMIWMFAKPSECMTIMWWWKRRITTAFLWLYYATENVWLAFLGWLYFSKLSRTILGSKDDSTPEFSDASWVIMMASLFFTLLMPFCLVEFCS
jgi:choline-glycine betaine transporter